MTVRVDRALRRPTVPTTVSDRTDLPSKRKVVLVFGMSFEPYQGRYLRTYNQAKSLVANGYDVTLLAWDRACASPKDEVRDGIRIKRFHIQAGVGQGPRKNAVKMWRFNRAVLAYLMSSDMEVIHCFNLDAILSTLIAARRRGAKAVLDVCEPEYYRGFWSKWFVWLLPGVDWLELCLARRFDHVFVHNTYQLKKYEKRGIRRLTQVGSYPNRAMVQSMPSTSADDQVVIGRLGTIYANNGFEELVAAFQKLLERKQRSGNDVRYKLLLAGRVFDSFRPTFDALIAPFNKHVEVLGTYEPKDLVDLYRRIDISVLLYGREFFGNVTPTKLFESMACGVPVVANAVGEMGQIITEEACGFVVDEKNPESICDGIERLASDSRLRRQMAENALQQAYEKYTFEACRERFLEAYRRL